ncbi:MAG: NUMOD3 domain-containing DNA-binding protein [Candidatus Paceibacterota bacterium]|jgi:hypothetical protein
MDKRFYTYVLINSLDGIPIYVGKGRCKRIIGQFSCLRNHKHYNTYLQRKANKIGIDNIIAKKLYAESEQDAFDTEIAWIKFAKESLKCKLCNITEGGEGVSCTKTEEWKRNIGISNKGRISPMKGKHISEEHRLKMIGNVFGKVNKGHNVSEETKKKISETKKGIKRPPFTEEWKHKMSLAAINRYHK